MNSVQEQFFAYKLNNKYYFNIWLALHHQMHEGGRVEFHANDGVFDQYDWSLESTQSLRELMSDTAKRLREKYERIVLLWSGGTDSHTIYNVFKENQIKIDQICIKITKHLPQYPNHHYDWIMKNHWDPETVITPYDMFDMELRKIDLPNEDWIMKNKGDLFLFGMSNGCDAVKSLMDEQHQGKKWIAITGFEKPRLIFRKGKWYARFLDNPFRQVLGYDHLFHFFMDPLINIKQSHIAKENVKKWIEINRLPLYDDDWAEAKYSYTELGYRIMAMNCGRDPEITDGVSLLQKIKTDEYWNINWNKQDGVQDLQYNAEPTLKEFLKNNDPVAKNYVKGFLNLKQEKKFYNWLHENNHLRREGELIQTEFVWSNEFCLGF